MVKITISPQSRAQFLRDVKQFQAVTGKRTEDVVDMIAASAGQQLMAKTLPIGTKAKGKGSGESLQSSIMAQIYRAAKRRIKDIRAGASVATVHKSTRDRQGTVPKDPQDANRRKIPLPDDSARSEAVATVRKMQYRAGLAKAGWLTASRMIGTPSKSTVPAYVKRHIGRAKGVGSRRGKGISGYTVTLDNQVAHMSSRLCPPRMMTSALSIAYGVVKWELDKVLNGGKPSKITLRKKRT
jgi:hypothetical protein